MNITQYEKVTRRHTRKMSSHDAFQCTTCLVSWHQKCCSEDGKKNLWVPRSTGKSNINIITCKNCILTWVLERSLKNGYNLLFEPCIPIYCFFHFFRQNRAPMVQKLMAGEYVLITPSPNELTLLLQESTWEKLRSKFHYCY